MCRNGFKSNFCRGNTERTFEKFPETSPNTFLKEFLKVPSRDLRSELRTSEESLSLEIFRKIFLKNALENSYIYVVLLTHSPDGTSGEIPAINCETVTTKNSEYLKENLNLRNLMENLRIIWSNLWKQCPNVHEKVTLEIASFSELFWEISGKKIPGEIPRGIS